MMMVTIASARNVDEMQFGGLAAQALEPSSSLSLVSSGYGTAACSEKSRWSQSEVRSTHILCDFLTVHVVCRLSDIKLTQKFTR